MTHLFKVFDMTGKPWTTEELEMLPVLNLTKTNSEIAKRFGRTRMAIAQKLLTTNASLKRVLPWQFAEDEACEFLEQKGFRILRRGQSSSVFDMIVTKENRTYAINVKLWNSHTLPAKFTNFQSLRKFGIPVLFCKTPTGWVWLEEHFIEGSR